MAALATWFTPVLSVLSRSDGKSAVAAAAYRACTRLHDALYKKVHDYTRKGGHVLSKIFGDHNFSIEELWNAAEAADTPMATPNCSTFGQSNCSRQDGRIMTIRA